MGRRSWSLGYPDNTLYFLFAIHGFVWVRSDIVLYTFECSRYISGKRSLDSSSHKSTWLGGEGPGRKGVGRMDWHCPLKKKKIQIMQHGLSQVWCLPLPAFPRHVYLLEPQTLLNTILHYVLCCSAPCLFLSIPLKIESFPRALLTCLSCLIGLAFQGSSP